MSTFIQLHLITPYPPANLNRDDMGRPKTCTVGGFERLRISSQSLKRAWRTSQVWESGLAGHVGVRTKEMGEYAYKALTEGRMLEDIIAGRDGAARDAITEKAARDAAKAIAAVFGSLDSAKKGKDGAEADPDAQPPQEEKRDTARKEKNRELHLKQLAHFSLEEIHAISKLVEQVRQSQKTPSGDALNLLRKNVRCADIALFGRMLADTPDANMEAACQVAHAFSVERVMVEDDFFTAVDDLNRDDMGAGHMGITAFGSGVFYLYVCINKSLLLKNLGNNSELANKALAALVEAMATVAPIGKQNSFGSRAYANYILAEKGSRQPRTLACAFVKPVADQDITSAAIDALTTARANLDKVYGACAEAEKAMNGLTGQGSLQDIIAFVTKE